MEIRSLNLTNQKLTPELIESILAQAGVTAQHRYALSVIHYFFGTEDKVVVVMAGRRWGKTFMNACIVLLHVLTTPEASVWVVAPHHSQVKECFKYLRRFLTDLQIDHKYTSTPYDCIHLGDLLSGGAVVEGRVTSNRTALRGSGLTLIIDDEAAYSDDPDHFWSDLYPATADKRGRILITSTPVANSWIDDVAKAFSAKIFRFPTWTNPFIDRNEIERARASLPQAVFEQEFAAKRVVPDSIAFPNMPIVDTRVVFPHYPITVGIDWGIASPFAAVKVYKLPDGSLYVQDEVYERRMTPASQVALVRVLVPERWEDVVFVADATVWRTPDGASESVGQQWAKYGLYTLRGTRDLLGSLSIMWQLLADGKIVVDPRCGNLLREFRRARIKVGQHGRFDLEGETHALDALRYAVERLRDAYVPRPVVEGSYEWMEMLIQKKKRREFADARRF